MSQKPTTLYEYCLHEIARLLKNRFWKLENNPFTFLPTYIIDALIVHVAQISISVPLEISDLHLLTTSGRVRKFTLKDVLPGREEINVSFKTLEKFLLDLIPSAHQLISIEINLYFLKNETPPSHLATITDALNCLLNKACNLKNLESNIEFDLHVLKHADKIEKLMLDFPLRNRIFDFLEVDGQLKLNTSLKYIEVSEEEDVTSYSDIAVLLQNCTELISVSFDISKSLEYLHSEEFKSQSLTHKYKIRQCRLGNYRASVSEDEVQLTSITCPRINVLNVLMSQNETISALSDFHELRYLILQWMPMAYSNYAEAVQLLLEKSHIGLCLTHLDLSGFQNVDFSSVGICCPNLKNLGLFSDWGVNRNKMSPTIFQYLRRLCLNTPGYDDEVSEVKPVTELLSNARNLENLLVSIGTKFTDNVIEEVLRNKGLTKLKKLCIFHSGITLQGMHKLATSLKDLEYFDGTEFEDEVMTLFHEKNPRVLVNLFLFHDNRNEKFWL